MTRDRLPGVPVATMTPAAKSDCETSTTYAGAEATRLYQTLPLVAGAPQLALIAASSASVVASVVSTVSLNGTAVGQLFSDPFVFLSGHCVRARRRTPSLLLTPPAAKTLLSVDTMTKKAHGFAGAASIPQWIDGCRPVICSTA